MSADLLFQNEDKWETEMGAFFVGERVVLRGKDLLRGLRGLGWTAHYLYALTGRFFSEREVRLLEGIWTMTVSYPDPRIWPNRIGSLAGTARSTGGLGLGAALAISEAELWGHRANSQAIDFFKRAKEAVDKGESLEKFARAYIKRYRGIPGYGRPVGDSDERFEPMLEFVESLGFENGPHYKLALELHEILHASRYRMFINAGGISASLGADLGFSSREYYYYALPSFTAGIMPCLVDAMEKPEGSFFPIRCDNVVNEDAARREW